MPVAGSFVVDLSITRECNTRIKPSIFQLNLLDEKSLLKRKGNCKAAFVLFSGDPEGIRTLDLQRDRLAC